MSAGEGGPNVSPNQFNGMQAQSGPEAGGEEMYVNGTLGEMPPDILPPTGSSLDAEAAALEQRILAGTRPPEVVNYVAAANSQREAAAVERAVQEGMDIGRRTGTALSAINKNGGPFKHQFRSSRGTNPPR